MADRPGFLIYRDSEDGSMFEYSPEGLQKAADHAMEATGGKVQLINRIRLNDFVGSGIYRDDLIEDEVAI